GSIDNTNIAAAAGIVGTKLATGTITATQLASDAVTTAKILNANVTAAKLAIGASTDARVGPTAVSAAVTVTTEQTLVTLPSLTTRGGPVVINGTIAGFMNAATLSTAATFKLFRGATLIASWTVTGQSASGTPAVPVAISPAFLDVPAAGSYVYKVNCVVPA